MTMINGAGQQIKFREISKAEAERIKELSELQYPRDRIEIEMLSDEDFRLWIYSMNPLQALNLASTRKFAWMRARRNAQEPLQKIIFDLTRERDFLKMQLDNLTNKWWIRLFLRFS